MKKRYTVRYKTITVYFDKNPRTGKCKCCDKKAKTQLHHWKYKYTIKEVKKNPKLALENTTELCYFCHRVANALKFVLEQKERIKKLRKLKRIK